MNLLRFSLCLLMIGSATILMAQRPQKVVRITKELHELSWYEQQAKSWQSFLKTNTADAAGWHSYYEANRAIRNLGGEPLEDLDQIVQNMKQHVPESFEYSFLVYRNRGLGLDDHEDHFAFLEKAHEIDPSRTEVLEDFVTHYEISWDLTQRRAYNVKRMQANDISYDILSYNYNVLMSLEKGAILFTNGDNDTYPLWLLQDAMGVRPDVIVLNCSLAALNDYLNLLLAHYEIPAFEKEIKSKEDFDNYHTDLRNHLLQKSGRPLYYGLTVNSGNFEAVKDKLYVVGLASKYSEERFDNSLVLAKNYEENFRMEYLKVDIYFYAASSPEGQFAQAYLMPLLSLHRHYLNKKETAKAAELKQLILRIARKAEREAEIKAVLK
ncbi:MAG: hypothetical protein AAF927_29050 [Bacteroidota bacterium]